MEVTIKENGDRMKFMEMESMFGAMVENIKVLGSIVK